MKKIKIKYFCFLFGYFAIFQITLYVLSELFDKSVEANSHAIDYVVPVPVFYVNFARILEISWVFPLVILIVGFLFTSSILKEIEDLVFFVSSIILLYFFSSIFIIFLSGFIWTRFWVPQIP